VDTQVRDSEGSRINTSAAANETYGRELTAGARRIAIPWIVRLRFGIVLGELGLIAAARFGLGVELQLSALVVAIALQASTNWLLVWPTGSDRPNIGHLLGALFALDTLFLTLVLAVTGGPMNPFSLLYLVQITFSALILHRAWTWALGGLSTLCFGLLFWVSSDVPALQIPVTSGEFSLHLLGMWAAFATAALLISFFIGKVTDEGRRKERELIAMQQRLARNERLASLVTLSAGAAHEIATPLATIAVTAKEIERQGDAGVAGEAIREDAALIRSQVDRCRQILERMGTQGADPLGEAPSRVRFDELLNRIRMALPGDGNRIQTEPRTGDPIICTLPVRPTVEALTALVKNALDASDDEQFVSVSVEMSEETIRFRVRDRGIGMTPEIVQRVAEPFFTTKPPGSGMGLGAFLAYLFAQRLGGSLLFDSEPGQGTSAWMTLPQNRHV